MSQTYEQKQEPFNINKVSVVRLLLALISMLVFLLLSSCRIKQGRLEHRQELIQEELRSCSQKVLKLDEKIWEDVCIEELSLCLDSLNPRQIKLVKRRLSRGERRVQKAMLDSSISVKKHQSLEHLEVKKSSIQTTSWCYYLGLLMLSIALLLFLSKHLSIKTLIK